MSYAAIMAYTEGDEASDIRIRIASDLAEQFGATLIGIAAGALRPPVATGDLTGREIEDEITALSTQLAEKERRFLTIACQSKGKSEWRSSNQRPNDAIAEEARSADLIVIGQDAGATDPLRSLDPGAVLLQAGRPVLVLPRSVQRLRAKKVLIAWQDFARGSPGRARQLAVFRTGRRSSADAGVRAR